MGKRPKALPNATAQRRPFKKQKGLKSVAQFNPVDGPAEEDLVVSDEDIAFVQDARTRLGFLEKLDPSVAARPSKPAGKAAKAADAENGATKRGRQEVEEDVADYEKVPRAITKDVGPKSKGLPIKSLDGQLMPAEAKATQPHKVTPAMLNVAGVQVEDALVEQEQRAEQKAAEQEAARKREEEARQQQLLQEQQQRAAQERAKALPPVLAAMNKLEDPLKRRHAGQQAMAVAAHKLLESPENNLAELKILNGLVADTDSVVSRFAMLTMTAVMKDIVPGYRIRLPTEEELQVKVTKDVQRVRDFESHLLSAYQAFLKRLQTVACGRPVSSGADMPPIQHTRIALKCMCTLLTSLPHFNYTSDILQIVVPRMASRDAEMAQLACGAVESTIQQDKQGRLAREIVQLVADLVKRRKCICPPSVVRSLFGLDFSEVLAQEAANADGDKGGKAKKKKPSKKKKKGTEDEVDQAFKEAQAGPDKQEQAVLQSETLEALFEVLFRVLKQAVACAERAPADRQWMRADMDKKCPLLGVTLQALSQYMYLISVEYFNDLMEVVKQLVRCGVLPLEERLRCLLTAAHILRGQGEALSVDRRQFYVQLYNLLLEVPLMRVSEDMEVTADLVQHGGGSDRPTSNDPSEQRGSSYQPESEAVLLARACSKMLCEVKMTDMSRLAAFVKRLASVSLHLTASHAMGLLVVAFRLVQRYPKLVNLLEWEGEAPVGGRSFNADISDPSEAGALAACLWEVGLLSKHYHPHMQQAAASLLSLSPGSTPHATGILATAHAPDSLSLLYSTTKGLFHPAPKPPGKAPKASRALSRAKDESALEEFLKREGVSGKTGEGGDVEFSEKELEAELAGYFRLNRCYNRNRGLRQEHARVTGILNRLQQYAQKRGMGKKTGLNLEIKSGRVSKQAKKNSTPNQAWQNGHASMPHTRHPNTASSLPSADVETTPSEATISKHFEALRRKHGKVSRSKSSEAFDTKSTRVPNSKSISKALEALTSEPSLKALQTPSSVKSKSSGQGKLSNSTKQLQLDGGNGSDQVRDKVVLSKKLRSKKLLQRMLGTAGKQGSLSSV